MEELSIDPASVASKIEDFIRREVEKLKREGAILGLSGAAALLGSVLRIKPVLYLKDGRVEALEKARTRRRAKERLLEIMEAWVGSAPAVHVAVLHAAAPEEAGALADQVASRFRCVE